MTSSLESLRIRLEGQLEIVEEAVAATRRAKQGLERSAWVNDSSWWPLAVESEGPKHAIAELARAEPGHELITTLEKETQALHRAALEAGHCRATRERHRGAALASQPSAAGHRQNATL